jgi:hypothetical protein
MGHCPVDAKSKDFRLTPSSVCPYKTITMFYSDEQSAQNQRKQQDQVALDRRVEGATDAAFAQLPVFADPDYLKGWIDALLTLPRDSEGRIRWNSPCRQFAFGRVDGDPEYQCEEF